MRTQTSFPSPSLPPTQTRSMSNRQFLRWAVGRSPDFFKLPRQVYCRFFVLARNCLSVVLSVGVGKRGAGSFMMREDWPLESSAKHGARKSSYMYARDTRKLSKMSAEARTARKWGKYWDERQEEGRIHEKKKKKKTNGKV